MDPLAERLRQQRESLGISVAQLAQRTNVREPYIHALEQGMYSMLPAVYVRSFIKTLGQALGIPTVELQRLITTNLDTNPPTGRTQGHVLQPKSINDATGPEEQIERTADSVSKLISRSTSNIQSAYVDLFRKKRTFMSKQQLFFVVGIVATCIIAYLAFFNSSTPDTAIPATDVINITEDSLTLTATVTDTCEFTITIDNQRNEKVMLIPNEEYTWSASDKFVISNVFNAGSISFQLNSNPLPKYGNTGEVLRELTITRKDITASNAPATPHASSSAGATPDTQKRSMTSPDTSPRIRRPISTEPRQTRVRQPQSIITRTPQRTYRR